MIKSENRREKKKKKKKKDDWQKYIYVGFDAYE